VPGEVRFGDDRTVVITDASGNPTVDAQLDPVTATPCAAISSGDGVGVAVYRHRMTREITSLGVPTIDLDVTTFGSYGRLIAKLFDEAPDGTRTLITRGVYRLTPARPGTWRFSCSAAGGVSNRATLPDWRSPARMHPSSSRRRRHSSPGSRTCELLCPPTRNPTPARSNRTPTSHPGPIRAASR
jgi:hypothetical protein